jgi:Family of unknown function (DUF6399)
MPASQATDPPAACPEPFRYDRSEVVSLLDQALHAPDNPSLRAFAEQHDLPPSTLHYWQRRREQIAAPEPLRDFFESPTGLAFLQRLTVAAHLVFQQANAVGIRPLICFFEYAGLAPFLACSYGVHQGLASTLQGLLVDYGTEQRESLASAMPARKITLCDDEVYLTQDPCLVAMDPVSGFLIVECYQSHRDADTWNRVVEQGLKGLSVEVVQGTSDMALGIIAHVTNGLGAHHSPDLMHLQQDLHRATSLPLQTQVKQAQEGVADAVYQALLVAAAMVDYQCGPSRPGRQADFDRRLEEENEHIQQAKDHLAECQDMQEEVKQAIRGLGDDYHPFNATTGEAVSVESLQTELQTRLEVIQYAADEAGLSGKSQQKISRVRKLLPQLVATLAWFWGQATALLATKTWSEEEKKLFTEKVLGWVYWRQASRRGRDAKHRQELRKVAQRCQEAAEADPLWKGMSKDQRQEMLALAEESAGRWVRSSSCVEGRNGVLRLRHHGRQGLSEKALATLTVLHNYWIQRPDGTTAAERFFGKQPDDLFEWLLKRFPEVPRPARSCKKAA